MTHVIIGAGGLCVCESCDHSKKVKMFQDRKTGKIVVTEFKKKEGKNVQRL